ncbi:arylsulfatase B-like [Amphiura filiformis]|uniref:arylsulfatase B-like n=1 Tax=Amphiura filiformis TaxID=82378 RepID=UPI003B222934
MQFLCKCLSVKISLHTLYRNTEMNPHIMKKSFFALSVMFIGFMFGLMATQYGTLVDNVTRLTKHVEQIIRHSSHRKQPNIIFILADDLGWNDVSYHNSSCDIHTPNIDRLAKEGVRLENYYAQATCSPSRASFMTGLYQSRHGVDRALSAGDAGCLPSNLTLLPQVLKRHGYTTHLVGKWHLGHSRRNCLPNQRDSTHFSIGEEGWRVAGLLTGRSCPFATTL